MLIRPTRKELTKHRKVGLRAYNCIHNPPAEAATSTPSETVARTDLPIESVLGLAALTATQADSAAATPAGTQTGRPARSTASKKDYNLARISMNSILPLAEQSQSSEEDSTMDESSN